MIGYKTRRRTSQIPNEWNAISEVKPIKITKA